MSDIIKTVHDGDRGYKNCLCCVCNKVSKCTPHNDFYTTDAHGDGLVCEACFAKYVKDILNKSNKMVVID